MSALAHAEKNTIPIPDAQLGGPEFGQEVLYWQPAGPDDTGRVVAIEHPGLPPANTGTAFGEVTAAAQLMQSEPLAPLFTYLGFDPRQETVHDAFGNAEVHSEVSLAHPTKFDALLQALPVDADHRPPRSAAYMRSDGTYGDLFTDQECVDEVSIDGGFLLSLGTNSGQEGQPDQPALIHDMLNHAPMLMLLPPRQMNYLRERARQAILPKAQNSFTNRLDRIATRTLFADIVTALECDKQPTPDGNLSEDSVRAWDRVGNTLYFLLLPESTDDDATLNLGLELRDQCYTLAAAAKQALTS